uniref:Uncharacterized protein n=1 Tax=Tetraodon nigroviridis TaxID=99883 RepID=H3C2U8_TETNG
WPGPSDSASAASTPNRPPREGRLTSATLADLGALLPQVSGGGRRRAGAAARPRELGPQQADVALREQPLPHHHGPVRPVPGVQLPGEPPGGPGPGGRQVRLRRAPRPPVSPRGSSLCAWQRAERSGPTLTCPIQRTSCLHECGVQWQHAAP